MAGVRERKKQQTRKAIQRSALRLIASQGYDSTTCEQIAAAAQVSPATLFRYFATKEDIVLQDDSDPMIAEAVRVRPEPEPALTAVRRGVASVLAGFPAAEREAARLRAALILSVPVLRSRSREPLDGLTQHLRTGLAQRSGPNTDDLADEVAAAACAGALAVAVERWVRDDGDLADHVDAALAVLGELTAEVGSNP